MAIWKIRNAGDGNLKVTWQEEWDVAENIGFAGLGLTAEAALKRIKHKIKRVDCTPQAAPRDGVENYVYSTATPGDLIIDGDHIGFLHLPVTELC